MVEQGTLPDEFADVGTLETIVNEAADTGINPPAITIVGAVVSVGERLAPFVGGELGGVVPSPSSDPTPAIEAKGPM